MNPFRSLCVVPGAALVVALCAAPLRSQEIDRALPPDTLVLIGTDDLDRLKQSFEESSYGRFLADPACESLRDVGKRLVEKVTAKVSDETGVDPMEMLGMLRGPVGIALLDVLDPDHTDLSTGTVPLSLFVLFGLEGDGAAFLDQIDLLLREDVEAGKVLRRTEEEGDVEVAVLVEADPAAAAQAAVPEMRYGVADGTFVLGVTSESLVQRGDFGTVLAGLGGGLDDTLADRDRYANSLAAGQGDGVRVFCDVRTIVERFVAASKESGEMAAEDRERAEKLGIWDVESLEGRVEMGAAGYRSDFLLRAAGQGHALRIADALMVSGSPDLFGLVPEGALSAWAVHLDLAAAFDATKEMLADVGFMTVEDMEQSIDGVNQQIGFDLVNDLLANLDTRGGYFTSRVEDELEALPGTEENPMSVAVLVGVRDGARLTALLEKLMQDSGWHATRKREEFLGREVFNVPLPIGFGVYYAVLDDLLVVSPARELVQDVLRRHGDSDLPSLLDDEEFAAVLERFDPGQCTYTYGDVAEGMKMSLQSLNLALQSGQLQGMPIHIEELALGSGFTIPDDAVIEKYFSGPAVSVSSLTPDGIRFQSFAP